MTESSLSTEGSSLLRSLAMAPDDGTRMPALFIGHGSPMNAIEENEFSRAWAEAAKSLPKPRAILCVSAHWETQGTQVTAMDRPSTIHDFYGFPATLFEKSYPAPGSADLARMVQDTVHRTSVKPDTEWGLDHGAWSVLCRMYPEADVPVVQLSLDTRKTPALHYELGSELSSLRQKGVLLLGSGNIVHNLREVRWEDMAHDWALSFDARVRDLISVGDHQGVIEAAGENLASRLAVPTPEHYLPLLYVLGSQGTKESASFFVERVTLGALSMRCVKIS